MVFQFSQTLWLILNVVVLPTHFIPFMRTSSCDDWWMQNKTKIGVTNTVKQWDEKIVTKKMKCSLFCPCQVCYLSIWEGASIARLDSRARLCCAKNANDAKALTNNVGVTSNTFFRPLWKHLFHGWFRLGTWWQGKESRNGHWQDSFTKKLQKICKRCQNLKLPKWFLQNWSFEIDMMSGITHSPLHWCEAVVQPGGVSNSHSFSCPTT